MIGSGCGFPKPFASRFSVPARGRPADKAAQVAGTSEIRIAPRQTRHFKLSE
jgi:hypothetical protein